MTQEPQRSDLVPAAKPTSGHVTSNRVTPGRVTPGEAERDASLIDLSPMSISTTIAEGAQLDQQRAFASWQASQSLQASLWRPPVAGMLSVIFAIVAFYHTTLLLAPLAIIAGIVAFFRKQRNWAAIGIIAGLVALISDVSFWALLGVTWTMHWLFWG